jgi:outer membrane receptor for ferrienterochelin and colicins
MIETMLHGMALALALGPPASPTGPAPLLAHRATVLQPSADTLPVPDTILRGREIVVRSTRTGQRVQDEAIRVEVIDREEIEEKLLMRPGSIAMLLAETGGVQLQSTGGGLGGSVVRIQGMPGRYTLLLADGLPLYGAQPGGLGVLQVPPADLEQVEVIKGMASALYGGQAMGGVVNLISRRPGDEPGAEFIANATSRGGVDLVAYAETPIRRGWSASAIGGVHRQEARDVDGSGWADLPSHERGTLRLRAFHQGGGGAAVLVTLGAMTEDRQGGTIPGQGLPPGSFAPGSPFVDRLDGRRLDGGVHLRRPVRVPGGGQGFFDLRGSIMEHAFDRGFGVAGVVAPPGRDHDAGGGVRTARFVEAGVSGLSGAHTWVIGAAWHGDRFRHRIPPGRGEALDFDHGAPGLFAQDEIRLTSDWTVAGSVRWDRHNRFGNRVSPRVSILHRPGAWTFRASAGGGYLAPTPLLDEIESAGMLGVARVRPLEVEHGRGASLDAARTWGAVEAAVTLFAHEARDQVRLLTGEGLPEVGNVAGVARTRGTELLLRYRAGEVTVTGSYLLVDAARPPTPGSTDRRVPLTPRHNLGLVAVWEDHDRGLLGLELYHTGRQPLEDNPWRDEGRSWLHAGILGELRREGWSVFLNLENLLGVRQTRWDQLLLPAPDPAGRPTTDIWTPLDGFTLNAGIRLRFGGHDDHDQDEGDHEQP